MFERGALDAHADELRLGVIELGLGRYHVGLGGNGWGTRGWLVDIAWTAALAALAVRAYRRDTGRA